MIPLLIRGLVILFVVYIFWRLLRRERGAPFKCATCQFCRSWDEDGSICVYNDKQVFKNPVHISNCTDYKREWTPPRR